MLKMRKLVDKWSISTFALFILVKFMQLLKAIGCKTKEDGWRKVTRVFLRTEESKFALACLNLDISSLLNKDNNDDSFNKHECIIRGLAEVFKVEPNAFWQLQWDRFSAQRLKRHNIDIVKADFDNKGALTCLMPYFDESSTDTEVSDLDPELKKVITDSLLNSYNQTRRLHDKIRPLTLRKQTHKLINAQFRKHPQANRSQAESYLDRILSSFFIHFEEMPRKEDESNWRFTPPEFIKHKHPGFGFLNIICRLNDAAPEMDLWVQCHHVCIDGLPMQEILEQLKKRLGRHREIIFPLPTQQQFSSPVPCSTRDDKMAVYYHGEIINFTSFLQTKDTMNERYITKLSSKDEGSYKRAITAFRLLIWELGIHPVFNGIKFLIPVDIPESSNRERTLGFVIVRPSLYFDNNKAQNGFLAFQDEFNRQIKAVMRRRSESYLFFELCTYFSPAMYEFILKLAPQAVKEFAGSLGVSIINKADLFVAPFSDVHSDGFIAISNFFNPAQNGDYTCYVSVKGQKDKVSLYLSAIREIAGTNQYNRTK